jgi:hypothetical protein
MSCILIRRTYDKNWEMIQPLVQKVIGLSWFSKMAARTRGHIWNPIGPKFGVDVEGAQIHIHTRLENSRSPLWPWKVGQIQNPGNMWCNLIRYTSHKNLVNLTTIQPLALKWKSLIFKMATWRPQNRSNRENQKKRWAYYPKVSANQVSLV